MERQVAVSKRSRVTGVRPSAEMERLVQLDRTLKAGRRHLLSLQKNDGHWCGELEGDSILESEYVLMLHFLGRSAEDRVRKACNYIRQQQLAEGGWAIFPGGPPDVSASVKAYFVLKWQGDDPESGHMVRARRAILDLGGVEAVNSFTKLYLSIFDQYEWRRAPAVPPELILLPSWFYLNIYEMSSWSRAIVVPLSVIWALKPTCPVPKHAYIDELRTAGGRERRSAVGRRERLWAALFTVVDYGIKTAEVLTLAKPFRSTSLRRCEAWIRPRLEASGGLAAIFPSIVNTIIAFRCLGYDDEDPIVRQQLHELEKLEIEDGDTLRVQPCFSPVWDTALCINALLEAGVDAEDSRIQQAAHWLLDREVKMPGDWRVNSPNGPVGGWYFEYANEFFPDCDDTAEILTVLSKVRMTDEVAEAQRVGALDRALRWQLSMQNRDGGWGAFDRGCNREVLTLVPFADHNAMIDPSTSDITSRTVEAMMAHGLDIRSAPVRRALRFLGREQESDGSWYGRWGANYIYGTWLALCALRSVGETAYRPCLSSASQRGVTWLLSHQNADGGWGESLLSYEDPSQKGVGESTASQTAWAMMGLLAAGALEATDEPAAADAIRSLHRAAAFLEQTQNADGSWHDVLWTGTGFPGVFYLRYHFYALYFPLQALSTYRRELENALRIGQAA